MKRNGDIIIGYELNDSYAQISYMSVGDAEPETATAVLGSEMFNIPVALYKKPNSNSWLYGKEALKSAEEFSADDGADLPIITRLLDLAVTGTQLNINDEPIDPIALLALFIKRSLSVLTIQVNMNNIAAFMFTVPALTPRIVAVMDQVAETLDFKPMCIYLQSYRESIYQYVIHQAEELYKHQVLLFDYTSHMKMYRLEANRRTTPIVVFINKENYPSLYYRTEPTDKMKQEWDEQFLTIAEKAIGTNVISSVFLIGEGFKEEWAYKSLSHLCRNRRVFRGNNLYSKGACYGALEKYQPSQISETMIFLGDDKLKANIGIRLLRNGQESYYAIVDAGVNWHECEKNFDVILDERNELILIVTSLTGGIVSERIIALEGLPDRPPRTTRINIDIRFTSAEIALLTATDLGFGDIFPAGGLRWVREISMKSYSKSAEDAD